MPVAIDKPVPDFTAPATSGKEVTLSALKGKQVVLYFYPKDSTPGCTTEGQGFRDQYAAFQKANTEVFGISRDGLKSHENFKCKQEFPFELISDKDEAVCQLFDVIKLKKLYGKEYMGVDRSTFLIDRDGVLRQEWRGVKVPGHVDAVLAAARRSTAPEPRPEKKAASAAFFIFHAADAIAWLPESREGPWARHPAPLSPGSPGGSRRTRPRSPRARRTATPRR